MIISRLWSYHIDKHTFLQTWAPRSLVGQYQYDISESIRHHWLSSTAALYSAIAFSIIKINDDNYAGTIVEVSVTIYDRSHFQIAHDDVIKWKHFSALLAICAGNSPVPGEFPHKGQWRGALMFSLICVWINGWVNNREAGDLRRYRAHYDVNVMLSILMDTS